MWCPGNLVFVHFWNRKHEYDRVRLGYLTLFPPGNGLNKNLQHKQICTKSPPGTLNFEVLMQPHHRRRRLLRMMQPEAPRPWVRGAGASRSGRGPGPSSLGMGGAPGRGPAVGSGVPRPGAPDTLPRDAACPAQVDVYHADANTISLRTLTRGRHAYHTSRICI